MKNAAKGLLTLSALFIAFSLSACGNNKEESSKISSESSLKEESKQTSVESSIESQKTESSQPTVASSNSKTSSSEPLGSSESKPSSSEESITPIIPSSIESSSSEPEPQVYEKYYFLNEEMNDPSEMEKDVSTGLFSITLIFNDASRFIIGGTNGTVEDAVIINTTLEEEYDFVTTGGEFLVINEPGTYTFTINPETNVLTISKAEEEHNSYICQIGYSEAQEFYFDRNTNTYLCTVEVFYSSENHYYSAVSVSPKGVDVEPLTITYGEGSQYITLGSTESHNYDYINESGEYLLKLNATTNVLSITKTPENHVHSYDEGHLVYDDESHFNRATCDHKDLKTNENAHEFGEWEIVTEATQTQDGKKKRTCEECGHKQTKTYSFGEDINEEEEAEKVYISAYSEEGSVNIFINDESYGNYASNQFEVGKTITIRIELQEGYSLVAWYKTIYDSALENYRDIFVTTNVEFQVTVSGYEEMSFKAVVAYTEPTDN